MEERERGVTGLGSAELFWMTEEHCLPRSLYLERNVCGEPTTGPGNPGTVCVKHTSPHVKISTEQLIRLNMHLKQMRCI